MLFGCAHCLDPLFKHLFITADSFAIVVDVENRIVKKAQRDLDISSCNRWGESQLRMRSRDSNKCLERTNRHWQLAGIRVVGVLGLLTQLCVTFSEELDCVLREYWSGGGSRISDILLKESTSEHLAVRGRVKERIEFFIDRRLFLCLLISQERLDKRFLSV